MSYSTGSGNAAAFVAALVAHAVAAGWTEVNGIATGFPLSKNGLFVSGQTTSGTVTDLSLNITTPNRPWSAFEFGIGQNASQAAANRTVRAYDLAFGVDEWHIFSDADGNYVNWCFRYGTDKYSEVFSHGGFGFIDKEGMTHGGIGYAASGDIPSYTTLSSSFARFYARCANGYPFNGSKQNYIDASSAGNARNCTTQYTIFAPGVCPTATTFPQPGETFTLGAKMTQGLGLGVNVESYIDKVIINDVTYGAHLSWIGSGSPNNPFLGTAALSPGPLILLPGTGNDDDFNGIYAGVFPNIRNCNIENIANGGEISYMGDTWKLFPVLRKTNRGRLGNPDKEHTTGPFGIAHKKIV